MKDSSAPSERREFELSLRAFLCILQSIPDHLLEEYNVRFGFNIPLSDRHFLSSFSRKAKADSRREVTAFFAFWSQETKSMRSDPQNPLSCLFSKRHIQIHRLPVKSDLAKLGVSDGSIKVIESAIVHKYNSKGELVSTSHNSSSTVNQPSASNPQVDWYFKDYDRAPILQLCEGGMNKMRVFVEAAHTRFP